MIGHQHYLFKKPSHSSEPRFKARYFHISGWKNRDVKRYYGERYLHLRPQEGTSKFLLTTTLCSCDTCKMHRAREIDRWCVTSRNILLGEFFVLQCRILILTQIWQLTLLDYWLHKSSTYLHSFTANFFFVCAWVFIVQVNSIQQQHFEVF